MSLAGKDELHRPFRITGQTGESVDVADDQVGPFVGGEPSGETDRQRAGIEHVLEGLGVRFRPLQTLGLFDERLAGKHDQPVLQRLVGLPQFGRCDPLEAGPDFRFTTLQVPVGRQHLVVEDAHLVGQPGRNVHTVGDVTDRNFFFAAVRPEAVPHATADDTMQVRNGVGAAARLEGEHRHAEGFGVIVRVDASQPHAGLDTQPEFVGERAEVFLDEAVVEPVMTGRDRRVRGEHSTGGGFPQGIVEGEPVVLDPHADDFERCERRVPLVHVNDAGVDPQGGQGTDAADPQHDLLADPGAVIAAVQPGGQLAVFVTVFRNVRVEQVQGNATDIQPPDPREDRTMPGLDGDLDRFPVGSDGLGHRQVGWLGEGVLFLLPAVLVDFLREVPLVVEQSDGDKRNPEVGGTLEVVAGQHTQTAGVNPQRLVQSEFGGEVSGGAMSENAGVRVSPCIGGVHVLLPAAVGPVDARVEHFLAGPALRDGRASTRAAAESGYVTVRPTGRGQSRERYW